jgi:hypothetical protein
MGLFSTITKVKGVSKGVSTIIEPKCIPTQMSTIVRVLMGILWDRYDPTKMCWLRQSAFHKVHLL